MSQAKHILVIAGEASGDMRAAELVSAIKAISPSTSFTGVGGDSMQKAGVVLFDHITSLAVIGIWEVLKNFGRIKKVFEKILAQVDQNKPDAAILVDYPGFNLRLAAELKKRGIKVIYYVSPQVWAWRENRIERIKEIVDCMIVLFPFEKEIYARHGMEVNYVGHPLVDEIHTQTSPSDVLKSIGLEAQGCTTIGLMPGSRQKEIQKHLPVMIEAARRLFEIDDRRQFLLLKASTISKEVLESYVPADLPIKIFDGNPHEGINAMSAAIVASGTATLETALLGKPLVVIYKTSWLTYEIAKRVIKIPYIGLVNIVAGKKIVPELIQDDCTATNLTHAVQSVLQDGILIEELKRVRTSLGQPGASKRAAEVVLKTLTN